MSQASASSTRLPMRNGILESRGASSNFMDGYEGARAKLREAPVLKVESIVLKAKPRRVWKRVDFYILQANGRRGPIGSLGNGRSP